jgi:hypothetical protein
MILKFKIPEEFLKFAEKSDPNRFNLYFISQNSQFMLRPSKSSKNLDTAIFIGKSTNNDFRKSLYQLFPENKVISVSEISFMKE